MLLIFYHILLAFIIRIFLLLVIVMLRFKLKNSREKSRPFECGFDPKDSARLPFSMRFFLLAVVFLIFDIELALLFPRVLGIKIILVKMTYFVRLLFLVILMVGVLHEWNQGSLSWVN